MEYFILVTVCAGVAGYLLIRRKKTQEPHDTYVCDVCGQKECLCRKVETKK